MNFENCVLRPSFLQNFPAFIDDRRSAASQKVKFIPTPA
jgi:hypothetical protein